jgi:hypothetical protein
MHLSLKRRQLEEIKNSQINTPTSSGDLQDGSTAGK